MCDIAKIIVRKKSTGKRVCRAPVGENLIFKTDYDSAHIRHICWNFGDGRRSSKIKPKHSYQTTGVKKITCHINHRYKLTKKFIIHDWHTHLSEPNAESEPIEEITGVNLRLVNNSDDNNLSVVIFQENRAISSNFPTVAWQVIPLTGSGDSQSFVFGDQLQAGANIEGTMTPRENTIPGDWWQVTEDYILEDVGSPFSDPNQIGIRNRFGPIFLLVDALIYRSNKVVARIDSIGPVTTAPFELRPTFFIGVVSGVTEGEFLTSEQLSNVNTQISILGVQSADIVITGDQTEGYNFSLGNVVFA